MDRRREKELEGYLSIASAVLRLNCTYSMALQVDQVESTQQNSTSVGVVLGRCRLRSA